MSKTVAIDFDGVLNIYDGWQGEDELFEIRPGAKKFLQMIFEEGYEIVIYTTRDSVNVIRWLSKYELCSFVHHVTDKKPPAIAYIDDRGICFNGDFLKTYKDLINFK